MFFNLGHVNQTEMHNERGAKNLYLTNGIFLSLFLSYFLATVFSPVLWQSINVQNHGSVI